MLSSQRHEQTRTRSTRQIKHTAHTLAVDAVWRHTRTRPNGRKSKLPNDAPTLAPSFEPTAKPTDTEKPSMEPTFGPTEPIGIIPDPTMQV